MKKIIVLICLLAPFALQAQVAGRHSFEAGLGLALPRELLYDNGNGMTENITGDVYAAYRFEIVKGLSVGATLSGVFPHKILGIEYIESRRDETTGQIVQTTKRFEKTTSYGALDAIVEYKTKQIGSVNFFFGLGGGMNGRYLPIDDDSWWFGPDMLIYAGVGIKDHLRITLGHHHDLHFPFKDLSFSAAPYYCLNLGWSF